MDDPLYTRLLIAVLMLTVAAQALFAALPWLDLAASGALADGTQGFAAARHPVLPRLNGAIRETFQFGAIALILWGLGAMILGRLRGDWLRVWAYFASSVILAPGILVNLVLKAHSGRARPATIEQFGGELVFTPAGVFTDQCARNCSYTSGEAALAACLAIVALTLCWANLTVLRRVVALLVAVAVVGGVSWLRMALGRHFLSDVVMSTLFTALVALALYRLLGIGRARRVVTPAALRAGLGAARRGLVRIARGRSSP
ncbi:membrane-associated PAP2 superfamily phosphatase [Rhodovulum bhavnagarense]|uniref:Membrane-associated PAP2 superfamily phosphatase n=1 Tax=Rhodovulum bhavnagarense TaxID=992286 RepID=A0A4R2RKI2_9RHOB|nr:phosphatase PAP2 family protein [Rhodovulum bhavnagarense]TCP63318.1 membrane-associated PAP2 superfamily phosphatase [Rhodovulum bhavnagarense]